MTQWSVDERIWRSHRWIIDIPYLMLWHRLPRKTAVGIFRWWVWYGGRHSVWHKSRGIDADPGAR